MNSTEIDGWADSAQRPFGADIVEKLTLPRQREMLEVGDGPTRI